MKDDNTYTLSTNVSIPAVGFGTWRITPDSAAETAVSAALRAGYRHIDTAKIYGNEPGVGKAIIGSNLAREEVFVTTKLWNEDQSYGSALQAVDESLMKLGLDYVDLYLVHWPQTGSRHDAWKAMQVIYESGKAKAVGVSNYTIRHLEELLSESKLRPAVNQVEFHPYIYEQQKPLLAYCKSHDILIEAYSPLSRHSQTIDERVVTIADTHGKTPSQVLLRWCLQHGTLPLPRSTNPEHIADNIAVYDFHLSDDDMQVLDQMSDGERVTSDPENIA